MSTCRTRRSTSPMETSPSISEHRHSPATISPLPSPPLDRSTAAWLRQLPGLVALNLRETVKNIYFGVIALAGVLFLITTSTTNIAGTITTIT